MYTIKIIVIMKKPMFYSMLTLYYKPKFQVDNFTLKSN